MDALSYKVRLAVLWLMHIAAFFAYRTLALSADATDVSVTNDDDVAAYLLVAMLFAFLALILPTRLDRLTNIVAGSIFATLQAIMLIDGLTAYPSASFNRMTAASVVIMATVVWLAARWPHTRTNSEATTIGSTTIGSTTTGSTAAGSTAATIQDRELAPPVIR